MGLYIQARITVGLEPGSRGLLDMGLCRKESGCDNFYKGDSKKAPPSDLAKYQGPFMPCHNETSSIAFSSLVPSSPVAPLFASIESVGPPPDRDPSQSVDTWLLKCIDPAVPEIDSLVNALLLATRRMIRYGVITCV